MYLRLLGSFRLSSCLPINSIIIGQSLGNIILVLIDYNLYIFVCYTYSHVHVCSPKQQLLVELEFIQSSLHISAVQLWEVLLHSSHHILLALKHCLPQSVVALLEEK